MAEGNPSHASGRSERCKHVDPLLRATAWLACGFSNTARVAEEKNGGSEKIKKHEVEEAGFKPGSDHLPAGRKSGLEAPSRSLPNPTRSERTSTGGTGTTGNPVCHGGRGGGGWGGGGQGGLQSLPTQPSQSSTGTKRLQPSPRIPRTMTSLPSSPPATSPSASR